MLRLHARVFRERLGWNMECASEFEVDQFDEMSPTYILYLTPTDFVIGCVRPRPAKGTTMLQSVLPQPLQSGQTVWLRSTVPASLRSGARCTYFILMLQITRLERQRHAYILERPMLNGA